MQTLSKVSVVIPVFNDGKYLGEALQSVLAQEYPEIEIIIVDDGSTDPKTTQQLKELNDSRIKVLFKKHEGVSAARNFAIGKATGKYVLPLDADDKIGEKFLAKAVTILEKDPTVKVVSGEVELFGIRTGRKILPDYSIEMLLGQNTMSITSLFRKSDFGKTNGFNVNMHEGFEDWDFWLTLLESGGEVRKLPEVAVYYRIKKKSRNFSLTHQQMQKLRRQIYENHKMLYSKYFFDPLKSFEYDLLLNSREYKLGKWLLKPLRVLFEKLR
jgi:glycosyltransferase involved in cell wall biosynthesis